MPALGVGSSRTADPKDNRNPQASRVHHAAGKALLEHLANANNDANPELMRLALKLATGAGKTTVMAMLIAWQTVNAIINQFSILIRCSGVTCG